MRVHPLQFQCTRLSSFLLLHRTDTLTLQFQAQQILLLGSRSGHAVSAAAATKTVPGKTIPRILPIGVVTAISSSAQSEGRLSLDVLQLLLGAIGFLFEALQEFLGIGETTTDPNRKVVIDKLKTNVFFPDDVVAFRDTLDVQGDACLINIMS